MCWRSALDERAGQGVDWVNSRGSSGSIGKTSMWVKRFNRQDFHVGQSAKLPRGSIRQETGEGDDVHQAVDAEHSRQNFFGWVF
ncbi:MAG: hypothetical protein A2341_22795 [Deltaproteobacteria bacterium RIFOXYB12_FULL_58_9]|nr:MAG: hypothetical protein A2341_22795 [Deltaproteobacteria bacterium RIFOXYB12_FULL_58_9]